MLKAILVDDEVAALRSLELLLQTYCPNVSVVGKGQSVSEGLELIRRHNPDIVFLDIEMPHGNGFELIEQSPDLNFEVIFITAYNQYAVKAFKYSAIDYILKPIDPEELVKAVSKVDELRKSLISPRERYAALFENLKEILPRKLVIPTEGTYKYIDLTQVMYIAENNKNFDFSLQDGQTVSVPKNSIDVEEMLLDKGFIVVNKTFIINLNKVIKVDKQGHGKVILEGGHTIVLDCTSKDFVIDKLLTFNSLKG